MLKIASELKVERKPCFKPGEFPDSDCQIWWIKTPIKDPYGGTDCIHPQPSCALPLHLISPTPESSGAPLLTLVNGRSSNIIFGQPIQSYIKSIKSYNILAKHPNSSNAQLSNLCQLFHPAEMSQAPPRCRSPQRCVSQTSRPVPGVDVRRQQGHPWCVAGST